MKNSIKYLFLLLIIIVVTDCSKKDEYSSDTIPKCGVSNPVFTSYPGITDSVLSLVPLGNLNPSGHTFPNDHHYLHCRVTQADYSALVP